jgi:hypothetical protein
MQNNALSSLLLALFLFSSSAVCAASDALMVYGDNFIFSVTEPEGWTGDIGNAEKFAANIVLHEEGRPPGSAVGVIRVRVSNKKDENTSEDMKADKDSYAGVVGIQFKDIEVVCRRQYRCLASVFFVPGKLYEYVTYLSPGEGKPVLLSISMNSGKTAATDKEMAAYIKVVHSLLVIKP